MKDGRRRPRFAAVAALAAALLVAGCAAPRTSALLQKPGDLPARAEVARVPFYPQTKYQCGPAALATLLSWSGDAVAPSTLVDTVYTPGRQGSLRSDVIAAARRQGRLAVRITGLRDLLGEVAAGHPVMVFQNLSLDWWPQWHFAVVYRYDLSAREIVLRSGTTESKVTDLHSFARTWARGDRWALVVLPPGELPARASVRDVLDGAVGLERAGRTEAAAETYAAVTARWPDSFAAWMGLGNTRFEQGRHAEARAAFRSALALRPRAPAAWNNLAYARAADGDRMRALAAARAAVHFAGTGAAPYKATLRELAAK